MEQNKKNMEKMEAGREYRAMQMEIRESDEGKLLVEGYATTFNEPYTLYDGRYYKIIEQIDSHAFDECDMSDVIMQYDHEGRVFARNKNGTLELSVDDKGLKIRANLGGTEIGKQLYEEIKGGYTDKMSFGFTVGEDKKEYVMDYENDVETCTRTITKVKKLFDVSAVSLPANDMTSISARRFSDGVIEKIKAERLERANRIKKIKIMMEV
ncbi:HK97 family phage prohead protease [Laedolimicola ammoniilytica]|uniref:HK97 family phage prohead protease n=1 Tax=Laedolimicola ammoniilytica TaxID=2981771 RepID=A0ABT2RY70_9FIRM|nr:HK97 family phage prohead protease [Laedolimicola ammoniilytica]MCU6697271.1 HK97 family phage prohead protease [Laedolimicola ammoniilytica]SCI17934.1 phage prohead protease%2C HK97 family [uncultured Clostridium sp.]